MVVQGLLSLPGGFIPRPAHWTPTMSAPNTLTDPATCPLNTEGVRACLRALGDQPAAEDVILLACRLRDQQIEKAHEEIGLYRLWCDDTGNFIGLKKGTSQRRMDRAHHRNDRNEVCYWWVNGSEHMQALAAAHKALTDIERRYNHRRAEVLAARPHSKHWYIAQVLLHNEKSRSADTLTAH